MGSSVIRSGAELTHVNAMRNLLLARPSIIVALTVLALYSLTPTANYYWDGLAFALRIEQVAKHTQSATELFHQNHLLYNAIWYLLYVIPSSLGLSVRALSVMQVASSASCAVGVSIFFVLARRIAGGVYPAVVGSALLAVSTCWWKAATDADAYSPSVVLVLVCASVLLSEEPRWYFAGLALAGAMLIHEFAAFFYPAAISAVALNDRIGSRFEFALKFSTLAWGVTIVSYFIVSRLVLGVTAPQDVIKWAASNPYGVSFVSPLFALRTFPQHLLDLIFGHSFKAFRRYGAAPELTFVTIGVIVACLAGFLLSRRASLKEFLRSIWQVAPSARDRWKRVIPILFIWISTYAVLFLFLPYTPHYHVYYMPAIVVMFALVLSNYHLRIARPPSLAAGLAVFALFFCNFGFFISPYMRLNSNQMVAEAKRANTKWNEHTVIYFTEMKSVEGAFQYFNERSDWRGFSPRAIKRQDRLDDEINLIYDQGGTVWLSDSAIKSADSAWLASHKKGDQFSVTLDGEDYRFIQLLPAR